MTFVNFLKRWMYRYINKIYFYLPWGDDDFSAANADEVKIKIKPVTQIRNGSYRPNKDSETARQYFYPSTAEWKPTGKVPIYKRYIEGIGEDSSKGCNYRLYKKVDDEYIAVSKDGTLDKADVKPLSSNTTTYTLTQGEYYYKEYIASEGDVLVFDCLRLKIFYKSNYYERDPNIIYDYEPKMLNELDPKLFIQYEVQDKTIHETFPEYITYLDKDKPDAEKQKVFTWEIRHLPRLVRTYVKYKQVEEQFTISPGDGVKNLYSGSSFAPGAVPSEKQPGEAQKDLSTQNSYHKVVPELYKITYMGREYQGTEKNILTVSPDNPNIYNKWCYINFLGQENTSSTITASTAHYRSYKGSLHIKPPYYKGNKALVYNDVVCATSYIALWTTYQQTNSQKKELNYGHIYAGEEYGKLGFNPPPGGQWVSVPGLRLETNDTYHYSSPDMKVQYSGFKPEAAKFSEQPLLNGTLYQFTLDTIKCQGLAHWSPRNGTPIERLPKDTVSIKPATHSAGYACAEDLAHIPAWISQFVTKDKDNPDGFTPPGGGVNVHQYYSVAIYENEEYDDVMKYDYKTYPSFTDIENPLYPQMSLWSRKAEQYDNVPTEFYPNLSEVEKYKWGCGVAVVISRQSRAAYKQWKPSTELFQSYDNYSIDYDAAEEAKKQSINEETSE